MAPATLPAIDLARLERALALTVDRMADGRLLVSGGSWPHVVDGASCDCADHSIRGGLCKHLLAVELRNGNEPVIQALAVLVNGLRAEMAVS